ncbi:DUF1501 domain-containing protein [Aquincola sp. MAHUQ-54]|uniref:DUF1501 domain-containing protein n=1 Tax=Aquincola agrisoli TaxID=3119538 RepID=A0AAW9Q647_9BURK
MNASRREFLRAGSGLLAAASRPGLGFHAPMALGLAGLGAMAAQSAHAADTSGYKALVCLFMAGGSDQHNWIVPTDATGYADYARVRQELAWPRGQLLPITSSHQGSGRSFGMPLELQPLQALYEAGQCAVVANVGPLEQPLTQAQYLAGGAGLPSKLFSHNDQQSMWQALAPEGAPSGWGGRMGDLLASANPHPVFTAVSAAGNAVFLSGSSVIPYRVGLDGPLAIRGLGEPWLHGSSTAAAALARVLKMEGDTLYQAEVRRTVQRSLETAAALQAALQASPVPALPTAPLTLPGGARIVLAGDPLAKQLRVVAQMIAAAPRMGMRRQVFMVQLGGFDSHSHQMHDQPLLMARVAQSAAWFHGTLAGLGMGSNVTLFTASDFGRTLVSNGDGSDHGWGSHHLVLGGAVRGRTIQGRFPVTALGTADDVGSGRLLPTTSVTQLAASLGAWIGLGTDELRTVLPTLGRFGAGPVLF